MIRSPADRLVLPSDVPTAVLRRAHLLAAGATGRQITDAVRDGRLLRLRRDHYLPRDTDPQVCAAVQWGGRLDCVSLLRLLGVFVRERAGLHIQLAPDASRTPRPGRRRRSSDIGVPPPAPPMMCSYPSARHSVQRCAASGLGMQSRLSTARGISGQWMKTVSLMSSRTFPGATDPCGRFSTNDPRPPHAAQSGMPRGTAGANRRRRPSGSPRRRLACHRVRQSLAPRDVGGPQTRPPQGCRRGRTRLHDPAAARRGHPLPSGMGDRGSPAGGSPRPSHHAAHRASSQLRRTVSGRPGLWPTGPEMLGSSGVVNGRRTRGAHVTGLPWGAGQASKPSPMSSMSSSRSSTDKKAPAAAFSWKASRSSRR